MDKFKGVFHIDGDKIIFQEYEYIENGWYVEMNNDDIVLFEIPEGGNEAIKVNSYHDVLTAIKDGRKLT